MHNKALIIESEIQIKRAIEPRARYYYKLIQVYCSNAQTFRSADHYQCVLNKPTVQLLHKLIMKLKITLRINSSSDLIYF